MCKVRQVFSWHAVEILKSAALFSHQWENTQNFNLNNYVSELWWSKQPLINPAINHHSQEHTNKSSEQKEKTKQLLIDSMLDNAPLFVLFCCVLIKIVIVLMTFFSRSTTIRWSILKHCLNTIVHEYSNHHCTTRYHQILFCNGYWL